MNRYTTKKSLSSELNEIKITSKNAFELEEKILKIKEISNRRKMCNKIDSMRRESDNQVLSILTGTPSISMRSLDSIVESSVDLEVEKHILRLKKEYDRFIK
jgi:hypothetical protein